jgi:hypothetical protein
MVIRTEYCGQRYSMGSSDPLPTGFKIRFMGLNFQATGNGYLMCLTNREELHARCQAWSAPIAAACVTATPTPASTDAAGPLAPGRRRRSGQRSRQARLKHRHAACVTAQRDAPSSTMTAPPPDRGALGLRTALPHRSARRHDGLQRQHQHHDAQGSPWPPRLGWQGP